MPSFSSVPSEIFMYFYILDNDILYIKSTSTIYFLYIYVYILANDQNRIYLRTYETKNNNNNNKNLVCCAKEKVLLLFLFFFSFFFCSVKYIYVAILVYLSKLCVLYGVIYGRNPGRIKWKFFERMIILFSPRFRSFRFFLSSFHSKWQNVHFLQIPLSFLIVFIFMLMILF